MAFSADAIGFFLQIEDQLSPALATAERNYDRFVRSLDKYNQRAFKSANAGMAELAGVVEGFRELPKVAAAGYDKALRRLRDKSKPIEQKINLIFTAKTQKTLGKTIGEAVARVLSKATLRLSASVPLAKSTLFDTTTALRQLYKTQSQPPDMAGMFRNIPRFAQGGVVPGAGNLDDVLAFLTPGEAVIPKRVTEQLQELAQGQVLPSGLKSLVISIESISDALEGIKEAGEAGLEPKAPMLYAKGMKALATQVDQLKDLMGSLSKRELRQFVSVLTKSQRTVKGLDEEMVAVNKTARESQDIFKNLMNKVISPARFLAIHAAVKTVQERFGGMAAQVSSTFSTLEGDQINSFVDNVNKMNQRMGLSRAELRAFKVDAVGALNNALPAGTASLTEMGEVMEAITEVGQKSQKVILDLSPAIVAMANASTANAQELALMAVRLEDLHGFSADEIAQQFEQVRLIAKTTFADSGQLIQQTQKNMEQLAQIIGASTKDEGSAILKNLQALSAGLEDTWADAGGTITTVISQAMSGNIDAIQNAAMLFQVSEDDLLRIFKDTEGDISGLMGNLAAQLERADPIQLQEMAKILEFPGAPEQLAAIAMRFDVVEQSIGRAQAVTVKQGEAMQGLAGAAAANKTAFALWTTAMGNALGNFELFGVKGVEVMDFIKEFNPLMLLSIAHIGKMGLSLVVMGGKAVFWLGAKAAAWFSLAAAQSTAAAASTAATGAVGASTGVISRLVTSLSTGIATFLTSVGAGLAAFLTSLGTGLAALTPAIPVILTLSVAVLAVGAALKLAEKPLVAFMGVLEVVVGMVGSVLSKAIDGIITIVQTMAQMRPTEMLALAASMLILGPAFAGMGLGILAMSVSLAASTLGFVVFAGVMSLLGGSGMSSMKDLIDSLVDTFAADPAKMRKAAEAMGHTVDFVVGLVAVVAGISGLAVGAMIGNLVSGVMGWFGAKSPFDQLADQAKDIKRTIISIAATFGSMSGTDMRNLALAREVFQHVAVFMRDYTRVAGIMEAASPSLLSAAVDKVASLFGIGSPFERLSKQGQEIAATVQTISETFAAVGPVLDKNMGPATSAFTKTSALMAAMEPLFAATKRAGELAGQLEGGAWWNLWLADGPLDNLAQNSGQIATVTTKLVKDFSALAEATGAGSMTKVIRGLEQTGIMLDEIDALARGVMNMSNAVDFLGKESITRATSKAINVVESAMHVRGALLQAVQATLAEPIGLQANAEAVVTPAQIEQAIMVKLHPETTDKPVHAELQKTNKLLEQLIASMGEGTGPATRPTTQPSRRARVSDATSQIADGG